MSLMRKHVQAEMAKREAELKAASHKVKTPQADMMRAQLRDHENQLKQVQSVQAKIVKKREFIGAYEAYVEGILQADAGEQDDIVMTMMVWALDVGDFDMALRIAAYALSHDLKMPKRFNRNIQTVLVEEMADFAKLNAGDKVMDGLDEKLLEAMILTEKLDMPDEARAKIYREMGNIVAEDKPDDAIEYWGKALKFDPSCGVKTKHDKLVKAKEKAEAEAKAAEEAKKNTETKSTPAAKKKPTPSAKKTTQAQSDKTPPEET